MRTVETLPTHKLRIRGRCLLSPSCFWGASSGIGQLVASAEQSTCTKRGLGLERHHRGPINSGDTFLSFRRSKKTQHDRSTRRRTCDAQPYLSSKPFRLGFPPANNTNAAPPSKTRRGQVGERRILLKTLSLTVKVRVRLENLPLLRDACGSVAHGPSGSGLRGSRHSLHASSQCARHSSRVCSAYNSSCVRA